MPDRFLRYKDIPDQLVSSLSWNKYSRDVLESYDTIDLCIEVKYLGIFLDQKLTQHSLLKDAASLAKIWCLKPKIMLLTCLAIVTPMVTYASLV